VPFASAGVIVIGLSGIGGVETVGLNGRSALVRGADREADDPAGAQIPLRRVKSNALTCRDGCDFADVSCSPRGSRLNMASKLQATPGDHPVNDVDPADTDLSPAIPNLFRGRYSSDATRPSTFASQQRDENKVHFWQGWSLVRSYLFGMFVIFLTLLANALARHTHSAMILTFVEVAGLLLIIWAGWILVWNLRHKGASKRN
jgi:hypothetical protein